MYTRRSARESPSEHRSAHFVHCQPSSMALVLPRSLRLLRAFATSGPAPLDLAAPPLLPSPTRLSGVVIQAAQLSPSLSGTDNTGRLANEGSQDSWRVRGVLGARYGVCKAPCFTQSAQWVQKRGFAEGATANREDTSQQRSRSWRRRSRSSMRPKGNSRRRSRSSRRPKGNSRRRSRVETKGSSLEPKRELTLPNPPSALPNPPSALPNPPSALRSSSLTPPRGVLQRRWTRPLP